MRNRHQSPLIAAARTLSFEPFEIDHMIDLRGRYRLDLDRGFPFAIKPLLFTNARGRFPLNWHERLEVFIPMAGTGQFRMGDRVVDFSPGDIIIVDNLKLHGLADFQGAERKAINLLFTPDLVYNLGSPPCDFVYLMPFYCQTEGITPVLRADTEDCVPVHDALARLLRCYFGAPDGHYTSAGCKAYLLEILYYLSRQFRSSDMAHSEYLKQQERAKRLGKIFDYLQRNYAEKITITCAAAEAGMSESHFMRFFKKATGMTFVAYLTRVRLSAAWQQLQNTTIPIAEIAGAVGFTDQCYFDRRFKHHFHLSPREVRNRGSIGTTTTP